MDDAQVLSRRGSDISLSPGDSALIQRRGWPARAIFKSGCRGATVTIGHTNVGLQVNVNKDDVTMSSVIRSPIHKFAGGVVWLLVTDDGCGQNEMQVLPGQRGPAPVSGWSTLALVKLEDLSCSHTQEEAFSLYVNMDDELLGPYTVYPSTRVEDLLEQLECDAPWDEGRRLHMSYSNKRIIMSGKNPLSYYGIVDEFSLSEDALSFY